MAGEKLYRYTYCRHRGDGSANLTTARKNFENWLREAEPGDRFFVGWTQWVECTRDGTVVWGNGEELPHVKWAATAEATEN